MSPLLYHLSYTATLPNLLTLKEFFVTVVSAAVMTMTDW